MQVRRRARSELSDLWVYPGDSRYSRFEKGAGWFGGMREGFKAG